MWYTTDQVQNALNNLTEEAEDNLDLPPSKAQDFTEAVRSLVESMIDKHRKDEEELARERRNNDY